MLRYGHEAHETLKAVWPIGSGDEDFLGPSGHPGLSEGSVLGTIIMLRPRPPMQMMFVIRALMCKSL